MTRGSASKAPPYLDYRLSFPARRTPLDSRNSTPTANNETHSQEMLEQEAWHSAKTHCLSCMSWGKNEPVKNSKGNFVISVWNMFIYAWKNWEIQFIQYNSNLDLSKTDTYFIWWRAKVVTRHNEKISPPRQTTSAREALFLQVIRNSINDRILQLIQQNVN